MIAAFVNKACGSWLVAARKKNKCAAPVCGGGSCACSWLAVRHVHSCSRPANQQSSRGVQGLCSWLCRSGRCTASHGAVKERGITATSVVVATPPLPASSDPGGLCCACVPALAAAPPPPCSSGLPVVLCLLQQWRGQAATGVGGWALTSGCNPRGSQEAYLRGMVVVVALHFDIHRSGSGRLWHDDGLRTHTVHLVCCASICARRVVGCAKQGRLAELTRHRCAGVDTWNKFRGLKQAAGM